MVLARSSCPDQLGGGGPFSKAVHKLHLGRIRPRVASGRVLPAPAMALPPRARTRLFGKVSSIHRAQRQLKYSWGLGAPGSDESWRQSLCGRPVYGVIPSRCGLIGSRNPRGAHYSSAGGWSRLRPHCCFPALYIRSGSWRRRVMNNPAERTIRLTGNSRPSNPRAGQRRQPELRIRHKAGPQTVTSRTLGRTASEGLTPHVIPVKLSSGCNLYSEAYL